MMRKRAEHDAADRLLRRQVGLCDEIGGAFFADIDATDPILYDARGGADGLFAHAEIFVVVFHVDQCNFLPGGATVSNCRAAKKVVGGRIRVKIGRIYP